MSAKDKNLSSTIEASIHLLHKVYFLEHLQHPKQNPPDPSAAIGSTTTQLGIHTTTVTQVLVLVARAPQNIRPLGRPANLTYPLFHPLLAIFLSGSTVTSDRPGVRCLMPFLWFTVMTLTFSGSEQVTGGCQLISSR